MNLKFKATESLGSYNGWWKEGNTLTYVRFTDGQTQDVPDGKAGQLLHDFPLNFERADKVETRVIDSPPVDRMFKRGRAKVK